MEMMRFSKLAAEVSKHFTEVFAMADPVGFDWFDPGKTMDLIEERQRLYDAQDKLASSAPAMPGRPGAQNAATPRAEQPELNERTQRWFELLPRPIRPNVMRCKFPHILDGLARTWGEPARFNEELSALLLVDRGTRQGFPFAIIQELHRVRDYYFDELNPEGARQVRKQSELNDQSR